MSEKVELEVTKLMIEFEKVRKGKNPKEIVKLGKKLLEKLNEDINEQIIGAGVVLKIVEENLLAEREAAEAAIKMGDGGLSTAEQRKAYASIVDEGLNRIEDSIERLKMLRKERKKVKKVVNEAERLLRKEFEIRKKE